MDLENNWADNQLGQMADFPPLYFIFIFVLQKLDIPQIKSQTMWQTQIN